MTADPSYDCARRWDEFVAVLYDAWEDEAALRRFIALPYHLDIMRRYRSRGSLRAP